MIWRLVFSFLCCAVDFPSEIIAGKWPTIVDEPVDTPGGWFHRAKNMAVETVRGNANWFTKALSFANLMGLATLILSWTLA